MAIAVEIAGADDVPARPGVGPDKALDEGRVLPARAHHALVLAAETTRISTLPRLPEMCAHRGGKTRSAPACIST